MFQEKRPSVEGSRGGQCFRGHLRARLCGHLRILIRDRIRALDLIRSDQDHDQVHA